MLAANIASITAFGVFGGTPCPGKHFVSIAAFAETLRLGCQWERDPWVELGSLPGTDGAANK